LGVAGNAIYPGVGGAIGAVVGAAIDTVASIYIQKALTPTRPRPELVRNTTSDQGNPAPVVYGNRVRVPGQVIYMSRIKETEVSATTKGKAEGSITYKYTTTVAIAFARSTVQEISSIFANGDLVYSSIGWDPGLQTANVHHIETYTLVQPGAGGGTYYTVLYYFPKDGSAPVIQAGTEVTVTGPAPQNTGANFIRCVYPLVPSGLDHDNWDIIGLLKGRMEDGATPGVPVLNPAGSYSFQSTSTNPLTDNQYIDTLPVFYTGQPDQLIDPLLDAHTPGNSPAYRGTTYVVLQDFNVTKFGGQLPRFEAILTVNPSARPVGRTIYEITQKSVTNIGIEVDTTDIEDIYVSGLMVLGPTQLKNTVRQLMELYFLDAFETFRISDVGQVWPVLKFVQRKDVGALAIPYADVGANEEGSQEYDKQEIAVTDRRDLPTGLVLDFINASNEYQPGSFAYTVRPANVMADTTVKVSTDLVLTPVQAQTLARQMFWTANVNHDQIRIKLPLKYSSVIPGDVVSWPMSGQDPDSVRFRVNKVSKGQNGILDLEGIIEDQNGYSQSFPVVYSSPLPRDPPGGVGTNMLYVLDMPSLFQGHATRFGIYTFVGIGVDRRPDEQPEFPGDPEIVEPTAIYKSIDDGSNFVYVDTHTQAGVYGLAVTVLGNANDIAWDTFNTVDIDIADPTRMFLTNAAEETVGSGLRNQAILGNEVIGFTTATLISPGRYRLSHLIRGRRDTISEAATHAVQEVFILLDNVTSIHFGDLQNLDYNRPVMFLGIPRGMPPGTAGLYNTVTRTPEAQTLQPFKPRSRWLKRGTDQTIRFYFKWRSRVIFRLFSGISAPRADDTHCFILEVYWMDPAAQDGYEFIRAIECCFEDDDEYWIEYTRDMQAYDFHRPDRILDGSYPVKLGLEIYKKSTTLGIGRRSVGVMDGLGPLLVYF
jgi:hypothetical protein